MLFSSLLNNEAFAQENLIDFEDNIEGLDTGSEIDLVRIEINRVSQDTIRNGRTSYERINAAGKIVELIIMEHDAGPPIVCQ